MDNIQLWSQQLTVKFFTPPKGDLKRKYVIMLNMMLNIVWLVEPNRLD